MEQILFEPNNSFFDKFSKNSFIVKNEGKTLRDFAEEMNLDYNMFTAIQDNKKLKLDDEIKTKSKVTLLFKVAGG